MNVGSTFSGVGGFDLGFERAGMRVVWQAEIDEWCRRVLRGHWPDAAIYDDVRAVGSGAFDEGQRGDAGSVGAGKAAGGRCESGGAIDLLCGGVPCQDLSVAASEQASRVSAPVSSLSSQGSQMSFGQDGLSLKTSLGSSPLPRAETLESFSQRWPKSGMAAPGGWSTLDTSEFPSGAVECSLSDVLEMTVSERYALSARAAKGILRRASVRGRALPEALRVALEALAA